MKRIFVITILLLVSSCAFISETVVRKNYQLTDKPPENLPANYGYIIGSFTADNNDDDYIRRLYFRGLSPNVNSVHDIITSQSGGLEEAFKKVDHNYFIYALPEGSYNFYYAEMTDNGKKWYPKKDFSVVFKVTAAKATYIGNINNIKITKPSWSWGTNDAGGYFEISDKSSTDISALKKQFPYLDLNNILLDIPKSAVGAENIIRFK